MTSRDERLRALENDLREESRKDAAHGANKEWAEWLRERYMASASAKWDAAQRIATLIAELGQEVGAVEPAWFYVRTPGADYDYTFTKTREEAIDLQDCDEPDEPIPLYTSPAHTSEARDAEVAELIEATRRLTADIEFRIDDPRSQLLDRARRATTAAVGCNCPGSAKVSYLSHAPNCPAREALGKFAAMRQEGGTP